MLPWARQRNRGTSVRTHLVWTMKFYHNNLDLMIDQLCITIERQGDPFLDEVGDLSHLSPCDLEEGRGPIGFISQGSSIWGAGPNVTMCLCYRQPIAHGPWFSTLESIILLSQQGKGHLLSSVDLLGINDEEQVELDD